MNSTPALQLPRRGLRSLVLVILIHVLIIWGLSSGLARDIVKKVVPPAVWVDEVVEPEKLVQPKLEIAKPEFTPPETPVIPAPEIQIDKSLPSPITVAVEADASPALAQGSHPAMPSEDGAPTSEAARPEALCSVMAPPAVPAVNWEGQAMFRIHARLQAGHVADVKVLSSTGGMDARTRRALLDSVQSALGAYQCRGNQGFEQEFVFKIVR